MSKKTRKNKKKQKVSKPKFLKIFLLILLFSIVAVFLSYFARGNEEDTKKNKIEDKKIEKKAIAKSKEVNDDFTFDNVVQKKKEEKEVTKVKELKEIKKEKPKRQVKVEKKETKINQLTKRDLYKHDKKTRPKLAIVIDDVVSAQQKKQILNIGYKVGMSFLPPTKGHLNSANIAQNLPFYMIHFPMQASPKFRGEEANTLHIYDSYEKIEKRVKKLRQWYPNAIYTNNHTGSVFTSNDKAMDNLFKALKKYNFIFVDSRTSHKSLAKKYTIKYGMPYIARNIFLDNKKDYKYIQHQLKRAINISKKIGFAVAIGHPHNMTIKVLKNSKHLLKDLDLIYINELPYLK